MQTAKSLALKVDSLKNTYASHGKIFDFYITCWGRIDDLTAVEVNFAERRLAVNSLDVAIDVLFKITKVLGKEFPIASLPCWQFLSTTCYSLSCQNMIKSVIVLAGSVGRSIDNLKLKKPASDSPNVTQKQKRRKTD